MQQGAHNSIVPPISTLSTAARSAPRGGGLPTTMTTSTTHSSTALAIVPAAAHAAEPSTTTPRLSSSRAKYALVPLADQQLQPTTLSPRDLREISKFVDSNIKLGHPHRSSRIGHVIPQGPFSKLSTGGDALLQMSLAPIHAKESALDVPLRLTCPREYHCPLMVDPRSNGTVATRIVSLLKGAVSIPAHWDGETQGGERDVAKLNAIRDAEIRASAANRAQHFAKEARALVTAGTLNYNSGNLEKALHAFGVAVKRFEVAGEAQGVAYCHNILGVAYYRLKEYKMALVHHKKQQVLSSAYGRSLAQLNLGVTYSALGELTFAEQAFQDSHRSAMEAQDSVLETIALGNLGLTYMRLGDVRKSQSYMEQCLEHCSIAGDRVGSSVCLLLLGEIYSIVDDSEHALFYFEHAFRVAGEAGVSDLQEIARVSIGVSRGNKFAKESLTAVAQQMGQEVGMAELLLALPHQ